MKDQVLRFSDTNSADDSGGRTWGLDGGLFWLVIGGVFTAVATLLLLFSGLKFSFSASLGAAVVPLALTLFYVFAFKQGKPPGYDTDLLDLWVNGPGFAPNPQLQTPHPLGLSKTADSFPF